MARSRTLQVEKLKTSHSFFSIGWLSIITAVKELWQKIFTHQSLPVSSIKSVFFVTLFLLSRFICCTRQEPEKGERAGVRSSLWRSCAPGPLPHHPARCGAGATVKLSSRRWFSSSASTERSSAQAPHLSSVPSVFGRMKAEQGSWEQAAGRRAEHKSLSPPSRNGRAGRKA